MFTAGADYSATPKMKAMCGCTEHGHQAVRDAIKANKLLKTAEVFAFMEWKTPNLSLIHIFGNMDGFSVGEPWNHRGIMDGVSIHAAASQDIWKDHPEKVLGTTADFVKKYPRCV